MASAVVLSGCGGSSSNAPAPQLTATTAPQPVSRPSSVTLSGKLSFDYVPHTVNSGLDFANVTARPIRGAVVEAVNASGTLLAQTISAADGSYSLNVDAAIDLRLQVKSQLLSSGAATWDFRVTDNTQDNQIYALQGSLASTGQNAQQTRDLHAPLGWTGQSYGETRVAAPFAILDSVYLAATTFAQLDPAIDFPPLELRWSVNNRTAIGDLAQGNIGTSAYHRDEDGAAIYILGEEDRDTDEFDAHVIVHEFGHYFEHQMSRTDSIGGLHSLDDRLDARVAFSEGWSNALSAIVLDNPIYRDSSGARQAAGFSYNLESKSISNPGWFNEASIGAVIYDIVDADADGADNLSAGLKPVYDVMRSESYRGTTVFATIFALADGLRREGDLNNAAIDRLLEAQSISGEGPNGSGEVNSGAIRSALPVYKEVALNGAAAELCSVDDAGVFNKLGNREFIFLNLAGEQQVKLSLVKSDGDTQRDPDFKIWRGTELVHSAASAAQGQEVFNGRLAAGDYVIEAFDFYNINGSGSRRGDGCYTFSAEG